MFDTRQPTLTDLRAIAEAIKGESIEDVRARIEAVKELADKVGGLAQLSEVLDTIESFRGE